MVKRTHTPPTPAEVRFWEQAYLHAPDGNGRHAPEYIAHKKADHANAAVIERRLFVKGASR